jgi:hypothetical protein
MITSTFSHPPVSQISRRAGNPKRGSVANRLEKMAVSLRTWGKPACLSVALLSRGLCRALVSRAPPSISLAARPPQRDVAPLHAADPAHPGLSPCLVRSLAVGAPCTGPLSHPKRDFAWSPRRTSPPCTATLVSGHMCFLFCLLYHRLPFSLSYASRSRRSGPGGTHRSRDNPERPFAPHPALCESSFT